MKSIENNVSHLTAVARIAPSRPARWLFKNDYLDMNAKSLDYGSGRGYDAKEYIMDMYDPYYAWESPRRRYTTILCTYVLCVVDPVVEAFIIKEVKGLLKKGGTAYFSVRRDQKVTGFTSRGTLQRKVTLKMPIVYQNKQFCIYKYTKRK